MMINYDNYNNTLIEGVVVILLLLLIIIVL